MKRAQHKWAPKEAILGRESLNECVVCGCHRVRQRSVFAGTIRFRTVYYAAFLNTKGRKTKGTRKAPPCVQGRLL